MAKLVVSFKLHVTYLKLLKLHVAQLRQLTQTQTQLLHDLNAHSDPLRNMKVTIF